jgi:hypothetical protein
MIPAKTDAQNATVSAMNGIEVAMVVALAGFLSRIECPHICLLISVGSLVLWRQSLNGDIQAAWLLGHRPDRARYLSLAVWPSRQARNERFGAQSCQSDHFSQAKHLVRK